MALESVSAAETQIESNNDEDLEDGEIPSDEDDEPIPPPITPKPPAEQPKPIAKQESQKNKNNFESKFNKNKKPPVQAGSKLDRFNKYKNPSEDWAGDVEKAIRAALEEDKAKNQDSKNKNKNSRNKSRKRSREEREDERSKEQKRRKPSDEEEGNEDDDEMLFVRGASPIRKDSRDISSPARRPNNDYESYESGSDYEERSGFNRHRENDNKRGGRGGRRGGKNDRGGKNKGRGHMRNDRNNRRNQNNDHIQDPDSVCVYFMQGKCHRGDDCPFSHNALPPRKMELCKFYLMDCCAKREKCLYMHHDFPCKFFHTGLKCTNAENCKFSHNPLNDQVKNILLKHLETAPKEILGDFPRLSREGALMMINNTAKASAQGQLNQGSGNQKIPSLFELNVQVPNSGNTGDGKEDDADHTSSQPKSGSKERKSPGKKTRWGSDEDRVPYEQIMLLQSANQLGLQLPNAALGLAVQKQLQQQLLLQQRIASMGFYSEASANEMEKAKEVKEREDFTKDVEEEEITAQVKVKKTKDDKTFDSTKDVDLRQLLNQAAKPPVVSIAEEAANLTTKIDEESDRDEETQLVIEMPVEDEDNRDRNSEKLKQEEQQMSTQSSSISLTSGASIDDAEIPSHLPKRAQELFLRIQQLQRAAQDSLKNMDDPDDKDNMDNPQGDWYSDDDDDDDDDGNNLTIVIKDSQKEENDLENDSKATSVEKEPLPPAIPQPAAIVDKLGDLSKIDISAEVSKLLSTIKAQSSTTNNKGSHSKEKAEQSAKNSTKSNSEQAGGPSVSKKAKLESSSEYGHQGKPKIDVYSNALPPFNQNSEISSVEDRFKSTIEEGIPSPKSSPNVNSSTSSAPVSRDPRMSRDPRQRRDDHKPNSPPPAGRSESKKESKPLRIENSIYSSGIINMDTHMDTDLRTKSDQDHRRKDMDLRQRFTSDFGDTDLRVVTPNVTRSDIDLRQMLSLPFKPAPSHVPCTEIDASISSHPPMPFKVYVVDIPRPYYTGLKLTRNDPQVKNDPRLRKIFRITDADLADSPMSPPPVKPDTPKSPPQVRTDPRRKALENSNQPTSSGNVPSSSLSSQQQSADNSMGMNSQGMPMGLGGNAPIMGNMGPMNMMGNMGGNGPMMGNMTNMGPMPPMSNMPPMGNMGPNGSHNMGPPNQMNFDPRFNAQRNSGAGLLGPAPVMGFGHEGQNYEGPNFPPGNFNNFGPNDGNMMGFGPNGPPPPPPNFGGNGGDWNGGNQSQSNRRGGRIRRRNRNRSNNNGGNRRSPP